MPNTDLLGVLTGRIGRSELPKKDIIAMLAQLIESVSSKTNAPSNEIVTTNLEVNEYVNNILVFTKENYEYLKLKLEFEEFEKVCILLIGGKSYNIFKMLNAGIQCPDVVPLTTRFYFELIGDVQNLISDIFQSVGGASNIHYPFNSYKPEVLQSISILIKRKIIEQVPSQKAEEAVRLAYRLLPVSGKIVRSAAIIEDSPDASLAGCGDSNAQLLQSNPEEDFALFRDNVIRVAASLFNIVGLENRGRLRDENGSNFNPGQGEAMAETAMPFVYPENYMDLTDDQLVNKVGAAYIFHKQMGYDGRDKIAIQLTNGTGATIADSCPGLPLVQVDRIVAQNIENYIIDTDSTRIDPETIVYYATNSIESSVEYIRIYTPVQNTCYLINEGYDWRLPDSEMKKEVAIPDSAIKPAFDLDLIQTLIGDSFVTGIERLYPGHDMESEYAIITNDDGTIRIECVQTRPITVEENQLIGTIPQTIDEEVLKYIRIGDVLSKGAVIATVYSAGNLPPVTRHNDSILFLNDTITQDDAVEYKQPGIKGFVEKLVTGKFTHAAVQAREMGIPCLTGVGDTLVDGEKYFIFTYPNSNGKGMVIAVNDTTQSYINELIAYHQVQVENAFPIKEKLANEPLRYFVSGINVSDSATAREFGRDGFGFKECTLFRPNPFLMANFRGFNYINPENDYRFDDLKDCLTKEVYDSVSEFEVFNYRHCGPQGNEHFARTHPDMKALYDKYGDDKFSAIQGATLTCEHPKFFQMVEIPMIKAVLEKLKSEGKDTKLKFTIEYPKSAQEVNIMLRMMEAAGLHTYQNLSVGPMIENVQMALDIGNINRGEFSEEQITCSFATNDLAAGAQGIDRQKGSGLAVVSEAGANPNPLLSIMYGTMEFVRVKFPKAKISVCGEIVANLEPDIAGILYNMGITSFAMPSPKDPTKFGGVYEFMQLLEKRIDPESGLINLPSLVRINTQNSELRKELQSNGFIF